MAAAKAPKVVLMVFLMALALKDIGNGDWASQADEADDASHLALDENFFSEENDESSGLEVNGTSEPTIFGDKTTTAKEKDDPVTTGPSENPTTFGKETAITEKNGRDAVGTPSESPTIFEEETTAASDKDGLGTATPSQSPTKFEEETTIIEKEGLDTRSPSESPTKFEEETTITEKEGLDTRTPSESPTIFGEETTTAIDGLDVGTTSEIPSIFGEETTDLIGEEGEGSGIEETTIPPALTEVITEENIDAEAQLKTTQTTDRKTDSGTRSEGPTTVIPTFNTEQKTESLESTPSILSSSGPVTAPITTEPKSAETSESTIATDRPTSVPETEPTSAEGSKTTIITDQPTSTTKTDGRDETSTKAEQATTISPTTDEGSGDVNIGADSVNKSADPCSRTFCKNGYMCVPTENGESAECRCPRECPQSASPCCTVYMEEYGSVCEMHRRACGLGLNIALRNMGKCSDSQSGSGYLPTIVAEENAPDSRCSQEEVLQFASRFQEWAMINKELAEGKDPSQVDLNSAIVHARLGGLSPVEKRQILKHQFTVMDVNTDRHLEKSEVEAFLRFVPSEHCLYGFMVSSDVDRNGIVSRDEWYGAFQFQSESLSINFGSKL